MNKKLICIAAASIALWVNPPPAKALAIQSFSRNFAPFLPQSFEQTDSFRLVFSEVNAIRLHRLLRIKYIINLRSLPGNPHIFIDIPFFFESLNAASSSNTVIPTLGLNGNPILPQDPVNLTLSGLGAFASTNSFVPFDNNILDSTNFASADLSFDVDTDGLLPGDGFTASIEQNNISIGSFLIQPNHVPGPLPLLGLGAAFGYSRKLRRQLNISKVPKLMRSIN